MAPPILNSTDARVLGTMDAMLTGTTDVWVRWKFCLYASSGRTDPTYGRQNPAPEVVQNCEKEVSEAIRYVPADILSLNNHRPCLCACDRVLRPGGKFIYLTFGQPHFRRRYLTRPGCSLEIKELGESFHYYLYVMTKDE